MAKQIKSALSKALDEKGSTKKQTITISIADPASTPVKELKKMTGSLGGENTASESPLVKSILNILNGDSNESIERLSFERDPTITNEFQALWYSKTRLLPDSVLKRIAIQDDLVAAIVAVRGNQMSAFGRPQPDRFSTGFKIEPKAGVLEGKTEEYKQEIQSRIEKARDNLSQCGRVAGWSDNERMTLSQFLYQQSRNAVVLGRFATEIVYVMEDGERKFHSFRPIDAGTIYKATPQTKAADQVRKQARLLLEQLKNEKFIPERMEHDEYAWVQVIEGRPVQAFTPEECVVHNVYPVTDIELAGYPITPIDTMIAAVTTHINIVTHNKLYFQAGRAARGMLIIKSEDVNPTVVATVRQQFNASINSVNNAHRMPVFGIGKDDEITWAPIDNSSRDMEFQYLSDSNARTILSAFQMSPEEIPGYAHLSRGTNSQALSECLSLDSLVFCSKNGISGLKKIKDILCNDSEVLTSIWDGTNWINARVFLSGKKNLFKTYVECGLTIESSPDHKFRTVGDAGNLIWKEQRDLKLGDWVAINKTPITSATKIPEYKGKPVNEAVMEYLGWATGDGTFVAPKKRAGGNIVTFYHHEFEQDIWKKHLKELTDFGINIQSKKHIISEEEKEQIKQSRNFKSVADFRIKNIVYETEFVNWLFDFGFTQSTGGKHIPSSLFTMPLNLRRAFLRGFFSADGGKLNKTGSVCITIQNDSLREQTRQLLMSVGIRTLSCNGIKRPKITKSGIQHKNGDISYKLFIKDRKEYWDTIGFIQDFKQLDSSAEKWSIGDLPKAFKIKYLSECVNSSLFKTLPKKLRDNVHSCLRVGTKRNCSMNFLSRVMELCKVATPLELSDYYYEKITKLEDCNQNVEMADVEMFNDVHAFVANGFVVHNSNSEYKLEAHRDVGIRPLLSQFQDFLNGRIFPLIDKNLSDKCVIKLVGLDAETAEKESVRLQQDMVIHMDYDEVREKVEKEPLGADFGGKLPLNPTIWEYINSLFTVGQILEKFCGVKGAAQQPELAYRRDQFWFSQVQVIQAQQQMQMQMQAQQQQAAQGAQGQPQQDPSKPPSGDGKQPEQSPEQGQDLTRGLDQLFNLLTKSEKQLSPSKRRVLAQQKKVVAETMSHWEKERDATLRNILDTVEHFTPKTAI